MFDVELANPFKKQFNRILNSLFSEKCLKEQSLTSNIQETAIKVVIQAWSALCNYVTRTYSFNLQEMLSQHFIHELIEEEKELLNINGKLSHRLTNH